jgi:HPt (histidine-containing phosphotransfer) domain-containing protein
MVKACEENVANMPSARQSQTQDRTEYHARRRSLLVPVYASSPDEKERIHEQAASAGFPSVSAYCLNAVRQYASARLYPPEYVESLKAEVAKLREWLEKAREEAEDYRASIKALQLERDTAVILACGTKEGHAEVKRQLIPAAPQEGIA